MHDKDKRSHQQVQRDFQESSPSAYYSVEEIGADYTRYHSRCKTQHAEKWKTTSKKIIKNGDIEMAK